MELANKIAQKPSSETGIGVTKLNIFEINSILECIASQLDFSNLKVFRQLNRTCYRESLLAWRKMTSIQFHPSADTRPSLAEFNEYVTKRNKRSYIDEMNVVFPVQNFSFKDWSTSTKDLDLFVILCAHNIKCLELVDCRYKDHITVDIFFAMLRTMIERVEALHIKCCLGVGISRPSIGSSHCQQFVPKLFSNIHCLPKLRKLKLELCWNADLSFTQKCPNLKELVLHDTSLCIFRHEWLQLLESAGEYRHPDQENNFMFPLTTLDALGSRILGPAELVKADFPLKHLTLDVSSWRPYDLSHVLNHYGRNLTTFKVLGAAVPKNNICQFRRVTPIFQNLIELELWGNTTDSLNFLVNTPVLARLKINCSGFGNPVATSRYMKFVHGRELYLNLVGKSSVLLEKKDFCVPTLREFVTDCRMQACSWIVLKNWMPNLRVLEAPILDNFTFGVVCGHWVDLEKLCLRFGSNVDDHGIIVGKQNNVGPVYPGISNLSNLNTFELEVECGRGRLTDRSAEFGFLTLQRLRSLTIGVSGRHFTNSMEARLKMVVAKVQVHRTCYKVSLGGYVLSCCEWADFINNRG